MLFLPMSKAVCLKSALLFATIRSYSFSYPYKSAIATGILLRTDLPSISQWSIQCCKNKRQYAKSVQEYSMRKRISELKSFHWRLWLSLCALALIPAVYQTVKTFLISAGGQNGVFDIIGQMEWFDLINEILQAFLIMPLYSVLNRIFKNHCDEFAGATFKAGVCVLLLYTLFSVGVLIYGSVLIGAMSPGEIDIAVTTLYLRLETVAFMTGIIVSFANVVFVVIGKEKNVYVFLAVRTALSLIADLVLIPSFGVYGVAVSNIISNALLSVMCILLLHKQGYIRFFRFKSSNGAMLRDWCKTGVFSGLQQFVDNLRYGLQNGEYDGRAGQLLDRKQFYLGMAAHSDHSPC